MNKILKLSKKTLLLLITIFGVVLVVMIININNHNNREQLEFRDGLIYRIGSKVPYTGDEIAKVNNKTIKYQIVDGKKDGEFKVSYFNGNPAIIGNLKANKNIGKWTYFYPDSVIESEGSFKNDTADGCWKWFYKNGKLRQKGNFIHGNRNGKWFFYGENGEVDSVKNFVN